MFNICLRIKICEMSDVQSRGNIISQSDIRHLISILGRRYTKDGVIASCYKKNGFAILKITCYNYSSNFITVSAPRYCNFSLTDSRRLQHTGIIPSKALTWIYYFRRIFRITVASFIYKYLLKNFHAYAELYQRRP